MGSNNRGIVTDFQTGVEKIDLSAIDADQSLLSLLTNISLVFAGELTGSNVINGVGQLSTGGVGYHYETINSVVHTIIDANVNSGRGADLPIDLVGRLTLTANDFSL